MIPIGPEKATSHRGIADVASVDLAATSGPATQRGAGILYGLTEDGTQPADDMILGMGFRFQRAGGAQLDSPGGWVAGRYERRWRSTHAQYLRTISLGGVFIGLVHDLYGADGTAIDTWPGDGGDWTRFEAFLDRLTGDARAASMRAQWDLWNEPDLDMFWARSREQFLEAWRLAYRKVRSALPGATIVGPSTASEPSETSDWWNSFMDYVAAHDVVPDVLSWHEIGGRDHGQDPVASRAAAEAMLATRRLRVQAFQVNEYAEPKQQNPGQSAWFLARMERARVDGLRANWGSGSELHDNLAGLLARTEAGHVPLADWFTYRAYASQLGDIAVSQPGDAVDVFATTSTTRDRAQLLVGNHGQVTGRVRIDVAGLDASSVAREDSARVSLARIPYGDGLPSLGPVPASAASVVQRSSSLAIDLDYADARDAFLITLEAP